MNMKLLFAVVFTLVVGMLFAEPYVTNVEAKQRYPWNGLVDITVTISGTEDECAVATFSFFLTNKATRAELPIGSVEAIGMVAGAGNTWTRRFVWNATADVGCAKLGEVELTVATPSMGVQLWENGPYWAEYNVGAIQPEECGYYFWWGDTVGYERNSANDGWVSVKDGSSFSFASRNCPVWTMDYSQLQSAGYIDATGNLVAAHDAATAHLGAPWRMPTDAEITALVNNCDTEWTTRNGVSGRLVKGRGAYSSKRIFLPAAGSGVYETKLYNLGLRGDYWSSTPHYNYAWGLNFDSGGFSRGYGNSYDGHSVRPVRGFAK